MGLPLVMMGRGEWQQGEPEIVEKTMSGTGAATMLLWAVIISAAFVLFALGLSFYLLFKHLSGYNEPKEQKWLIGIILMVPVYAVTSFLSLLLPKLAIYFTIMGNCYEAFALYAFGCYLIACLGAGTLWYSIGWFSYNINNFFPFVVHSRGGEQMAVERLAKQGSVGAHTPLLDKNIKSPVVIHPIPLRWCLQPWELGRPFYDTAKFGIVQYVIIKVICSWAALILSIFNAYGEGDFDFSMGYPYITILQNFSQMWALYCLVQFYYATKHELHEINPLAKFLCFKAVVFVTWWQGVVIALVFATGLAGKWLPFHFSEEQADMLQTNLQDFIICIEMAIAAVAHIYVYPATPYQRGKHHNLNKIDSVADELEEDIEGAVTSVKDSVKDVVIGGGEHVVEDVKITVAQAAEPVESGFTNLNETLQGNVSKVNEKFHENVSKLNENVQDKVYKWGGRETKEISKEGTYFVNRNEGDEILQTHEHVALEHESKGEGSQHCTGETSEVVKGEVSGTTTSQSTDESLPHGEETVTFRQQKKLDSAAEERKTSSTIRETNEAGQVETDSSLNVKEKFRLNSKGCIVGKDMTAQKTKTTGEGDVVSKVVVEEQERDKNGGLVTKEVQTSPTTR